MHLPMSSFLLHKGSIGAGVGAGAGAGAGVGAGVGINGIQVHAPLSSLNPSQHDVHLAVTLSQSLHCVLTATHAPLISTVLNQHAVHLPSTYLIHPVCCNILLLTDTNILEITKTVRSIFINVIFCKLLTFLKYNVLYYQ